MTKIQLESGVEEVLVMLLTLANLYTPVAHTGGFRLANKNDIIQHIVGLKKAIE